MSAAIHHQAKKRLRSKLHGGWVGLASHDKLFRAKCGVDMMECFPSIRQVMLLHNNVTMDDDRTWHPKLLFCAKQLNC